MAIGTGQVGENVRCQLQWSDSSDESNSKRPLSVALKLPSLDPASRQAAATTRTYVREVGFYRDAADQVAVRVPTAYFISEDQPNNSFALVMEDIYPSLQGEQLEGSTPEQANLAVASAAQLHGSTWNAPWIAELEWADVRDRALAERHAELFTMLFPGFMSRYGDQFSNSERTHCQWLNDRIKAYFLLNANPDIQALTHGDFRLDNLLFGPIATSTESSPPTTPPLTVVDWQTATIQSPLADVSYFVGTSISPLEQADVLDPLLDLYQATLGTLNVSTDRPWIDEQVSRLAPAGLIMAVIASQIVGQTERGDAMFLIMAKGALHLMEVTETFTSLP